MLVTVKRDFLEHPPLHCAGATAEIVVALVATGDETMKHVPPHDFEPAADPRPAPADREIRLVEGAHELADLHPLHLVIGRQRDDQPTRGPLEARHERGRFAKTLRETDDDEVLAAGEQSLQGRRDLGTW